MSTLLLGDPIPFSSYSDSNLVSGFQDWRSYRQLSSFSFCKVTIVKKKPTCQVFFLLKKKTKKEVLQYLKNKKSGAPS